ncbi:MAG TPA: hypothetical protein VNN77_11715 [candidate division Zixibacteria bacterium]|nr:hypothetical protein [candidate division Zixibacteria bacterium]
MSKYRARPCPNCKYYVGFTVARSFFRAQQAAVTGFCLNCGYRLPVHTVIRGTRRVVSSFRKRWVKLVESEQGGAPGAPESPPPSQPARPPFDPGAFSRHLRTVGQQLEELRLREFNLECTEKAYRIWAPAQAALPEPLSGWRRPGERLRKWWAARLRRREPPAPDHPAPRLHYSRAEIERLDALGRSRRTAAGKAADGHSLSQLLRTVGALVSERNQRLLAVSWRDLGVCVVVETAQGKREIDVFRPDNLYDLWVRMYLRRNQRALSDVPR